METCCWQDRRRDAVRHQFGWNGLDYLEVTIEPAPSTGATLTVYFLGKLPPEFGGTNPDIQQFLQIEGGRQIKDVRIVSVDVMVDSDPEKDDILLVRLNKSGDFSTYTLRLVGVEHIDKRYDHLDFSFKIDCPSDLDCISPCTCEPPVVDQPEINYLAKDYASFRQLILDRMAVLMPDWKERHVPDLGIALVELLAYAGDYLSYCQDAVATEAYLATARQRISVRRHVRLVDYVLQEGCNARAWISLELNDETSALELDSADVAFVTGLGQGLAGELSAVNWNQIGDVPQGSYEVFEPLPSRPSRKFQFYRERNQIRFYTWGERECCLAKGSTSATLLDSWIPGEPPTLALSTLTEGDVLVFEEVIGPKTGVPADADPRRRHGVRVTGITRGIDPVVVTEEGQPTPYVEIRWSQDDALPFTLCISAMGPAPECRYIEDISIARGNVVLVDHGKTQDAECLGEVPEAGTLPACDCEGHPGDIRRLPGRFTPKLSSTPLTYSASLPVDAPFASCSALLKQDASDALPNLHLFSLSADVRRLFAPATPCDVPASLIQDDRGDWLAFPIERLPQPVTDRFADGKLPALRWEVRYDLLDSGPDDRHFVVEIDNDGIAHLRFGNGNLGVQPEAGAVFFAQYRTGNGTAGNVGAESINELVMTKTKPDALFKVRNPLPAVGGKEPEPIAEAKLYAPHLFRKKIERAITADDYRAIAERDAKLQRASATLSWTGSWYEADVAVDPNGTEDADNTLLAEVAGTLHPYRRIGHDLRIMQAHYVPVDLKLEICVLPNYQRAHVHAALLDAFSNRRLGSGKRGFFHPDNLSFGDSIYISKIISAAMEITGVECARVTRLKRQFEMANGEIDSGLLTLRNDEIAQLDNNPLYPERGKLELTLSGGR